METFEKIVKDLLNKYKSRLKEEQYQKLTKVNSAERIIEYKAKVEVLQELLDKKK